MYLMSTACSIFMEGFLLAHFFNGWRYANTDEGIPYFIACT